MLRRASTSFAAQMVSLALTFADRIVLIGILLRAWGTSIYSDWAMLVAGAGLISVGELGLNVYFGNSWQKAFAQHDNPRFEKLIGISLFTYLVLGIVLAALAGAFVLIADLNGVFHLRAVTQQEALFVILLLAGTNVLRVMRGSISQIYRGRGQFAAGILVGNVATAATIVFAACAALLGANIVYVALVYLLADIFAGWVVMALDLVRRFPELSVRIMVPTLRELSDMGSKMSWYGLLQGAPIVWLQVPVLMLGALDLAGSALVSFLLARTMVNFARQFSTMLSLSVGVETASAFHLGDTESVGRQLSAFGEFLSGFTGAIAGGLVIFGSPIIVLWTGKRELIDPILLVCLLSPMLLVTPALPLSTMLTLGNMPKPAGVASLFQIVLGLALGYFLGLQFGVVGVAAGLGIGEAVALGVFLPAVASHYVGHAYPRYLLRCTLTFSLAAVWSWVVAASVAASTDVTRVIPLLLAGVIWGLFGFSPTVFFALPIRQRASLFYMFDKWRCWIAPR